MKDQGFGIIAIWRENGVNRFLLVQSQKAKKWNFPKGHPEADETPIESALRELEEETSVKDINLIEGLFYTDEYSFLLDGQTVEKTVRFFVGIVKNPKVTIQEEEIADYKWATYEEALSLISFERPKEILMEVVDKVLK